MVFAIVPVSIQEIEDVKLFMRIEYIYIYYARWSKQQMLIPGDRTSGHDGATIGSGWRLVTAGVMDGISDRRQAE